MNDEDAEELIITDTLPASEIKISEVYNTATDDSQITLTQQHSIVIVPDRAITLSQYLNSLTNNLYSDYEEIGKKYAYTALAIVFVLIGIAYVYSSPSGANAQFRWKKSIRKMKRLSKNVIPALKTSVYRIYPYIKDVASITQVIVTSLLE